MWRRVPSSWGSSSYSAPSGCAASTRGASPLERLVLLDRLLQAAAQFVRQGFARTDLVSDLGMLRRHELEQSLLPLFDLRHVHVVDQSIGNREDDDHLLLDRHRLYCGCFSTSTTRAPRASCFCV